MIKERYEKFLDYMKNWMIPPKEKRLNDVFSPEALKEMEKWYLEFY